MQRLLSPLRRAVEEFEMIKENEKVVVGLSGGKDSLVLLTLLSAYRKFSTKNFSLAAVMIDMGFKDLDKGEVEALKKYVESLSDVEFQIVKTDIGEIIFDIRKEDNPCSFCARMRRGALNQKVLEMGSHTLALGHHNDDLLETFLLSFIYESRLATFQPVTYLSRSDITQIRPMVYIEEADIIGLCNKLSLPIVHNPCPMNHYSQREYMKNLVKNINADIPGAKDRMMRAVCHPDRYSLWKEKI